MSERQPTLRERRRSETRRLVQAHAVRLFTDHGYDAVTVADVAEAAGCLGNDRVPALSHQGGPRPH